jgi:hypothetical protein
MKTLALVFTTLLFGCARAMADVNARSAVVAYVRP